MKRTDEGVVSLRISGFFLHPVLGVASLAVVHAQEGLVLSLDRRWRKRREQKKS